MKPINVIFPESEEDMEKAAQLYESGEAASGEDSFQEVEDDGSDGSDESPPEKGLKSIRAKYKRKKPK